ncbi:MAG: arabinosyltransferase domain-containing protein, partial [Pseudonocardia sp.]
MTATRDAGDAPPEAASVAEPIVPAPAPAARARSPWALRAAALAGLVALVGGLVLPFAPVVVSTPTLAWPRDAARVESTLLPLTAHRPLGLDVRFGCDTVRRAAAVRDTGDGRGSGTVLATALPGSGQAAAALVVNGVADRVQVRVRGAVVVDEPLPAGACTYRLVGTDAGLPLDVRGPPTPLGGIDPAVPIERVPSDPRAVAGPASARVVAERDGVEVGRWEGERLPDVDVLLSSLNSVDTGAAGELAVSLRVDDESTTSPAPAKTALTVVLGLALLATVVLLVLADRGVRPPGPRWPGLRWPGPAALVDLGVVGVLALWTFVAPATDDDGYFSLQARNAALTGTVGDYVQFQNRSFTPFTWPYQALAEWQQWAGTAPVLQRVPAAVCGLLTWVALRALIRPVAGRPSVDRPSVGRASVGRAAAAVAFLAWWLPYDMGVRPEPVVALCATAAAALLLLAATGRRLAVAWLALAVAGAGAVAHTGGVVLLGVLVAGLPLLVPLLRGTSGAGARVPHTVLRAVAVGSALATALLLGFADGALRDFLRGQAVTGAVFTPDGWADEAGRYAFLLDPIPMGSFARR